MKKINIVSTTGDVISSVEPKGLAVESIHNQAVFDAVNTENQNKRQSTAHTKTKSEVSGTGKKPYKQKHTGRARQGSRRNPQFVGGGCAFGPRNNRNFCVKINKQVHSLAFKSVWADIFKNEQVSILAKDFLSEVKIPKTSLVFNFLKKMDLNEKKVLLVIESGENILESSSRNISNIIVKKVGNLSVRDLLNQKHILVSDSAWTVINNKIN